MDSLQYFQEQSDLIRIRTSSMHARFVQAKDAYSELMDLVKDLSIYKKEFHYPINPSDLESFLDSLHELLDVLAGFSQDILSLKSLLSKEVYFEPRTD